MKIPFNKPYLSGNELKNIEDAIGKGHISGDGFYTKACHEWFENIEQLREHQNTKHKDFFESHEKQMNREPAPGDVTVF